MNLLHTSLDGPTEFEIASEAYTNLKKWWPYGVRGQYEVHCQETYGIAVFDIVLLTPKSELFLVIEVKKKKSSKNWFKQKEKYETISGCRVFHVIGMESARNVVQNVQNFIKSEELE